METASDKERAAAAETPACHTSAVAETETRHARRETEVLRELLAYIRDHVELPDDLVGKIDAILRG